MTKFQEYLNKLNDLFEHKKVLSLAGHSSYFHNMAIFSLIKPIENGLTEDECIRLRDYSIGLLQRLVEEDNSNQ